MRLPRLSPRAATGPGPKASKTPDPFRVESFPDRKTQNLVFHREPVEVRF